MRRAIKAEHDANIMNDRVKMKDALDAHEKIESKLEKQVIRRLESQVASLQSVLLRFDKSQYIIETELTTSHKQASRTRPKFSSFDSPPRTNRKV